MEGIKKKLATLKDERDKAVEKAEEAELKRKEAEVKLDEVTLLLLERVATSLNWLWPSV